jgi:antitoxin Xre/MbcA/ParS-like protein
MVAESFDLAKRPKEGVVLTKATLRAADRLGLSQRILGNVLGLSESVVSRMRNGIYS